MKIVVTGAEGLIGKHVSVRLHALNCAAQYRGDAHPNHNIFLNHNDFDDDEKLYHAIKDADAVLHFAGVNRGPEQLVERANPAIAQRIVDFCEEANSKPHMVYANSVHSFSDNAYGRSKRLAGEILEDYFQYYTNLILPHIFGEGARPHYNNVTATFIDCIIQGQTPKIDPEGCVSLLHAGDVAQIALQAIEARCCGDVQPTGRQMLVSELWLELEHLHKCYEANIYPNLSDKFTLELFNTYRAALYPAKFPQSLTLNSDERGNLFEAVKGGGGGQTFLSTTRPGITRGDHFHLNKVERFLVLQGKAKIRIRHVFSDEIWTFDVSGDTPEVVDMPTLCTHSLENTGETDLLTLFWTHDLFDPEHPDTYAEKVLE